MQAELVTENPATRIRMAGINLAGADAGNPDIVDGRSLPWLQDTFDQAVWVRWEAAHYDVIILDDRNGAVAAYNLGDHDLTDPANYAELKALLRDVARE